jgi:hypothetical protein
MIVVVDVVVVVIAVLYFSTNRSYVIERSFSAANKNIG